jgi:transcriptional repressor NrdR
MKQRTVIDSPQKKQHDRRRRECERCTRRFTTYERVEEMMLAVVKKTAACVTIASKHQWLKRACEKRPVSNTIEAVADRVEHDQERGEKEIPSSVIGEALMRAA